MTLHQSEKSTTKLPSRIHRAGHVLREFRRLRLKVERAYERAVTVEEKAWCRQSADALDTIILAGAAMLPPFRDPRPGRKARKRPVGVPLNFLEDRRP
jgi:hypothetical protein